MSNKIDHRARLIEFTYGHEAEGRYALRYIFWRVRPDQLNWFENHFCNHWRQLYQHCLGSWNPYFTAKDFIYKLKPLKTVGDIYDFCKEQGKQIEKWHHKDNDWPQNLNE